MCDSTFSPSFCDTVHSLPPQQHTVTLMTFSGHDGSDVLTHEKEEEGNSLVLNTVSDMGLSYDGGATLSTLHSIDGAQAEMLMTSAMGSLHHLRSLQATSHVLVSASDDDFFFESSDAMVDELIDNPDDFGLLVHLTLEPAPLHPYSMG